MHIKPRFLGSIVLVATASACSGSSGEPANFSVPDSSIPQGGSGGASASGSGGARGD